MKIVALQYSKMLSELTQDTMRNELIASDVAIETRENKGVCLYSLIEKPIVRPYRACYGVNIR